MHNTAYVIRFIIGLTAVAALLLSFFASSLKPMHERNEALFKKRAILKAIEQPLGREVNNMSDEEVQEIFNQNFEQQVIDMEGNIVPQEQIEARGYTGGKAEDVNMEKEKKKPESERISPLFIYEKDGEKYYIVSVRGSGLWDEIWGNIALKEDLETIAGATFDHKAETPGLGAEIKDNPSFSEQFIGKTIYNEQGNYTSVKVRKGGARDTEHEVDGISGATITSDGVTEMLYRGIKYYEPYFEKLESGQEQEE